MRVTSSSLSHPPHCRRTYANDGLNVNALAKMGVGESKMPRMDVISRDWEKAIKIVQESYPDVQEGSPQFWSLVFGVVKRMRGRKSARHLRWMGVLEKQLGNIEYLPYIFHQKVRGIDLWMDLPPHPAKVPPSGIPYMPAARSWFVDLIRQKCEERNWSAEKLADEVISDIIENPILVAFDDEQLESLVKKGKVFLNSVSPVSDDDEVGWKLAWVYAMLSNKVQPISPRWGYRLAQLTRDIKNTALQRLMEHFQEARVGGVLDKFNDDFVVKDFRAKEGCGVLNPTVFVQNKILGVIGYESRESRSVEEMWEVVKEVLVATVPLWVCYALHVVGELDLDEVKYLFPTSLESDDFLFVVTNNEDILREEDAKVEVIPYPSNSKELSNEIKVRMKRWAREVRDEIVATVRRRWV